MQKFKLLSMAIVASLLTQAIGLAVVKSCLGNLPDIQRAADVASYGVSLVVGLIVVVRAFGWWSALVGVLYGT